MPANPRLIKKLREHYKNPFVKSINTGTTPLQIICKEFDLTYPGKKGSQIEVDVETRGFKIKEGETRSKDPFEATRLMVAYRDKSPDQDVINLYLEVIHSSRFLYPEKDDETNSKAIQANRKKFKRLFGLLNPKQLSEVFDRLHEYGFMDLLEKNLGPENEDSNALPLSLREKLKKWKRDNGIELGNDTNAPINEKNNLPDDAENIIARKQAWFNEQTWVDLFISNIQADFVKEDEKTWLEASKKILYPLDLEISENEWVKYFFNLAEKSTDNVQIKKVLNFILIAQMLGRVTNTQNPHASNWKSGWEHALKNKSIAYHIFKTAHEYNLLSELYFALNAKDTFSPKNSGKLLEKWCSEQGINLRQILVECDIPETSEDDPRLAKGVEKSLILIDPALQSKVIDMKEVVRWGDGDEGPAHISSERTQIPTIYIPEFRYKRILDLLKEIDIQAEQINAIYRQNDEHVIDLITNAGRAQILVADYREVYIIRDEKFSPSSLPLHRSPDQTTQHDEKINFLLDRSDVWKFIMPRGDEIDPERMEYVKDRLREFILTPANLLREQAKHRVSWEHKGSKIELSVIMTVLATGQVLKKDDTERFKYGPLVKIEGATPAKANNALTKGTVEKFKDKPSIKSIRTLWDAAAKKEPELESFENTEPVNVQGILADCERIIKEYGMVPSNDTAPAFEGEANAQIMGHTIEEIQVALKYGVLQGSGRFLLNEADLANNLEDLQIQAGLAKRDDATGELHPIAA